jgi:hypothetical protein
MSFHVRLTKGPLSNQSSPCLVNQASVVALVVYKFNAQEEDVLFRTNVW